MAVTPVNLARVSQNLRALHLTESVRRNTLELYHVQTQMATGLRVIRPSDDPLRANVVGTLERRLDQIQQLEHNLLHANNVLRESESAVSDAMNLMREVESIASQAVGDTISSDERKALASVVDNILEQLVSVGNRQYLNTYLFSGHMGGAQPFDWTNGGVMYLGDEARMRTTVATDAARDDFTLSGAELFGAVSTRVQGNVDLDPQLTRQTRISELRGTAGEGVTLGQVTISDGAEQVLVDLTGADTVGDLVDRLNAELPQTLQATLGSRSIEITSTGDPMSLTIAEVGGGQTARDLGLLVTNAAAAGLGVDLDPALTPRTRIEDLFVGGGLPAGSQLTLRNGTRSATITIDGAETLEDLLNRMNGADVGVWARVAADGRTIEVLNRVSGTALSIGENGGSLATALGIRSMQRDTPLTELNDGRGIETVDGADLRFTTASGAVIEVDLTGVETLGDVIDRINAAAGGNLTAGLTGTDNGLLITDLTAGPGALRIERANLSPALDGLGLDVQPMGNQLVGQDVNGVRVDNIFTALHELRDGLQRDDRQTIINAGARLEGALNEMQAVQGQLASQARAMDKRVSQMEHELSAAEVLLSDTRDADLADVIVRLQQVQTSLQANLATGTRIMNMSLLDYLA